jgi:diguanylate cyclase (GGDEF)-like protein
MARLITSGKDYVIFAAQLFILLVLFGILLLIDFAAYLKLASAFLFLMFLVGWFLLNFSKLQQKYQLLIEAQKCDYRKLSRMSELAAEFSKVPLARSRLPEIKPALVDLFRECLGADTFVLFVKKRNLYQILLSHNVTLPQKGRSGIKSSTEFVSLVKSAEGIGHLEFLESARIPSSLLSLQKQYGLDRLISLSTESDLWGFAIFRAGEKPSAPNEQHSERSWEERLAILVFNQVALGLQKEDSAIKLQDLEKKSAASAKQSKIELSALNRDLKRKIFDLNTVLELVRKLYSVQEQERLFSELARMMQDHLGAKSVFLMLPDKEKGDITGRYFYGAQASDLFGEGTISELKIEKGKALYHWIKNERQIWYLYTMQKLSREDRLLKALLESGFQVGAKLSFSGGIFGTVFLGEKADGAKYRQTDLDLLSLLLNVAVITCENIRHLKNVEELSYTDSITGLYNYRYFHKRLTEEVFRAKRFGRKLALVIFDIDDFKIYNDTYGHQAGDQLLKQLGEMLSRTVRSIDVVSRYGGEEFCVIMPESDQEECLKFLERLRKNMMNYPFKDEHSKEEHNITISLGGAIYPHDARSVDRLIYCADMALLRAKSTGKNRSVMYQEKLAAVTS